MQKAPRKAETAAARSFLPSALAFHPESRRDFRGNLIRITRRLITAGAVSGWHTQAFPVNAAKQPQALHFFNTAGFSRSEKFAYNEYAASSE
jgi:hypothetical protein